MDTVSIIYMSSIAIPEGGMSVKLNRGSIRKQYYNLYTALLTAFLSPVSVQSIARRQHLLTSVAIEASTA